MTRQEFVLATLASVKGVAYSPVQVQKMFFLLDDKVPRKVYKPRFNFTPYNYGPFDKAVYEELEGLIRAGSVETCPEKTWDNYKVTEIGQKQGDKLLSFLSSDVRTYMRRLSSFVRRLTFTELVSAMYKAYPGMRENSVFQG